MNSKYLRLCTQGSVSLNSYTSCVECSALCWKQFRLKTRELLQIVPLKMDRFVTRKRDSKKLLKNRGALLLRILVFYSNSSVPENKLIFQVRREHQ
jgi:hypothetical protein